MDCNGEGELVHLRQFDTGYDEADFIAEDIKKEVRQEHHIMTTRCFTERMHSPVFWKKNLLR